jgi:sigma-E factor negative regulatory protein RseA
MSNEELESQLSAMFDGELPGSECELLARRLARDDGLKARWGRYAVIGAAMRLEPSACVAGSLAGRVSVVVAEEPSLLVGGAMGRHGKALAAPLRRWWQPTVGAAGVAVAAGVAAVAVFLLRTGSPAAPLVVQSAVVPSLAAIPATRPTVLSDTSETSLSGNFSGAAPIVESASFAPPVELADFLLAHSEFSMPFLRRSALSALVAAESLDVSSAPPSEASNDSNGDASSNLGTQHAAAQAN